MADGPAGSVVRQLGMLFDSGSLAGLSDRQLLERFCAHRDASGEAAFAALVARHGPMVLHVCRQVIEDRHLAEDAFQAVFCVLARRARAIHDPDRLGNWLYGVALRTARCARNRLARHRKTEETGLMIGSGTSVPADPTVPPADETVAAREEAEALHVEIERLPAAFRLPVVLCYLEGLTVHEAARRLRWPHGTVRSRMARGREKLRRGLLRRGFTLSTTAIAAALSPRSASASVSFLLCDSTTKAAITFAARHAASGGALSASATAMAREVLRSMMIHKLKAAALSLVLLVTAATGALSALAQSREGEPPGEPREQARTEPRPPKPPRPPDATRPAPGRMFVVGRVLAPNGKPVPNATIGVSMRRKLLYAGLGTEGVYPTPSGGADGDAAGRFQLDAPRASSAHHAGFTATAIAPGYGVGWTEPDPDEDQPVGDITLQPEQVIEGRLFDVQGRPVAGAVVSVWSIQRVLPPIVFAQGREIEDRSEGPSHWWGRVNDLPGWPRPATTDADGRFTLHGIGRGLQVSLSVLDPRFAPQTIEVTTDAPSGVKDLKAALLPTRTVTGRVTYADTGQPAAHAEVHAGGNSGQRRVHYRADYMTETDADGRFRINPMPVDRLNVWAAAPEGQPYVNVGQTKPWPKGATEQSVDLALPRAVLIRGKVTEEGTGQPVADAMVSFSPYRPEGAPSQGGGWARTKPDGSFTFPAAPGPGHVSVQAPGEDYQLQVIGSLQFHNGKAGGRRLYAHAFLPWDPSKGTETPEIHVALRRGATVKVRLIGPDGQPGRDVRVYSRAVLGPAFASALRMWFPPPDEVARHGQFEVHGLDAETEIPVHFLQPELKLGATVRVSGKMAAGGPITVRLEPCGQARARLVGPDGQPVTGPARSGLVQMIVTPGPRIRSAQAMAGALAADEDLMERIDPTNYHQSLMADSQGRITLPALIPGATYGISHRSAATGAQVRREFVVGPGEALELGDIPVQKPSR